MGNPPVIECIGSWLSIKVSTYDPNGRYFKLYDFAYARWQLLSSDQQNNIADQVKAGIPLPAQYTWAMAPSDTVMVPIAALVFDAYKVLVEQTVADSALFLSYAWNRSGPANQSTTTANVVQLYAISPPYSSYVSWYWVSGGYNYDATVALVNAWCAAYNAKTPLPTAPQPYVTHFQAHAQDSQQLIGNIQDGMVELGRFYTPTPLGPSFHQLGTLTPAHWPTPPPPTHSPLLLLLVLAVAGFALYQTQK